MRRDSHGGGSGAAHLVTGHGVEHAALEEELAAFTGRERALLFSTGYMANLAAIARCGSGRESCCWTPESCLAHRRRAALAVRASARYAHGDGGSRRARARTKRTAHRWSRQTACSAWMAISRRCPSWRARLARIKAWLIVDDAHGIGVHGRAPAAARWSTSGSAPKKCQCSSARWARPSARSAHSSPASADLIELLMQKARTYIYTTALPQPVAAATRKALERRRSANRWRRERVLALTARFRAGAAQLGSPLAHSETPIQPVILGSAEAALKCAEGAVRPRGFWVVAIRPPTVPAGARAAHHALGGAHRRSGGRASRSARPLARG